VDTVNFSVIMKFNVNHFWTDERLIGWSGALPNRLWGPALKLGNNREGLNRNDLNNWLLFNKEIGRMRLGTQFIGGVHNPMDLRQFPFDTDSIELKFKAMASRQKGATGRLFTANATHWTARAVETYNEKTSTVAFYSTHVNQWSIRGYKIGIRETRVQAGNFSFFDFVVGINVSRHCGFYFWKVVLPLYFLMAMSFSTFMFEVDELEQRVNVISTMFLAAFAVLYVVNELVPKTDFLTKIDKLIIAVSSYSYLIASPLVIASLLAAACI
jgi:hypothetical protein